MSRVPLPFEGPEYVLGEDGAVSAEPLEPGVEMSRDRH
jgi:hypothetical protein